MVDSQYYLPNDIGVSALDCREAFSLLSPREQMYSHYLSRAAWYVDVKNKHYVELFMNDVPKSRLLSKSKTH